MTISEILAEYIVGLDFSDLPERVVEKTKRCILDSVGCMLGGSKIRIGRVLTEFAKRIGGREESTIIGNGEMTSCTNAAFVNSELANALDYDDTYVGHPGATIIPPAISLGEALHSTGKDLILATLVGYEVSLRIGLAIRPTLEREDKVAGFQTWQTFGAAAASAKLLGLNRKTTTMALGIAGAGAPVPSDLKCSINPLNKQIGASMIKNNYGWSSEAGVKAALLAKMGYTGPINIFEGETGFWRFSGSDRCDFETMTEGLGKENYILRVGFKPYPCCRYIHPAIDASLKIVKEHGIATEDIRKILIKLFSFLTYSPWDDLQPKTPVSAIHSIPYCIAVAIKGLKPHEWLTEESLKNDKMLTLARKVELVGDAEADRLLTEGKRFLAKVQIDSSKGVFQERVNCPKGDPANPMTKEESVAKFRDLAQEVISDEKTKEAIQTIDQLEDLRDISNLTRRLR